MQRAGVQLPAVRLQLPAVGRSASTVKRLEGSLSIRRDPVVWRRPAIEVDFSDPSFYLGVAGAVLGLGIGIGFPIFMVSRDKLDEERLEALRQLNKETYEATGEYLSKDELSKLRSPRWTDRREYKDED